MIFFEFIGALVTILVSIGGAYLTIRLTLVKHDEKIDQIKAELDDIKENRETDFKELRHDIKSIVSSISDIKIDLATLRERINK